MLDPGRDLAAVQAMAHAVHDVPHAGPAQEVQARGEVASALASPSGPRGP